MSIFLKSVWHLNKDLVLLNQGVEEGSNQVILLAFHIEPCYQRKYDLHYSRLCHRCIGIVVVDTVPLSESTSDLTCLKAIW
jgi:hypothetical protein